MGGRDALHRMKRKIRRARAISGLAGLVERRTPLIGRHKGRKFKASLLRSGVIRFNGKLYESPRAAARAAVGRPISGWSFWHLRDREGDWVRL